ncbi:hypothetical protein B0H16DRAFT_1511729 [Mycena metata]|uniref:HNH nuclease domain-containing protein n=1 Tax=Mycena metata TaxID=1033252 RepID=A0AAD7JYT5_9AGAR|nr:hypothetical protein B0H16DRAFT_1511729 [Mycena metata]
MEGRIYLQLVKDFLTLNIPIASVNANSVDARPYLEFLIYAILGTKGDIEVQDEGVQDEVQVAETLGWRKMGKKETLVNMSVYRYADSERYETMGTVNKTPNLPDLVYRDLNAKMPSEYETTASRPGQTEFANELMEAAGRVCVFCGKSGIFCQASHIIRYASAHYLPIIQQHREAENSPVNDVQSARNGLYVSTDIHKVLETFCCSILPLPNATMSKEDVAQKERVFERQDLGPPGNNKRYIFQQLQDPGRGIENFVGQDAWFLVTPNEEAGPVYPAQHLLEYHYGVAAVLAWAGSYTDPRPKPLRPSGEPSSIRPQTDQHGHVLNKLNIEGDASTGVSSDHASPSGSRPTEADRVEGALDLVAGLRALSPENVAARDQTNQRLKAGVYEWLQSVPTSD